ncbi:MAG TPA: HDIG domain-containing protein [Tenuifilaceae bacterium]|nr:HDIG domain-containing protein [Tenuifilaceae bacterium]HPJ44455.1 HDIG domain-containing protein [Tenuifilaceae bacterium]
MKQLLRFIKLYYRQIIRVLYFIASIILIVSFLPREGKFKYEFQKGKPWMHEDLIAPFDFPIYKTENEILSERNVILKNFKPIFDYDTSTVKNTTSSLTSDFIASWTLSQYSLVEKDPNNIFSQKVESIVQTIYDKGIVNPSIVTELNLESNANITMLINSLAYETPLTSTYTPQSAASYFVDEINEFVSDKPFQNEAEILTSLAIQKYFSPNLTYNKQTTEKLKAEVLSSISLTEGLIQTGERIVNRGEVVNEQSYKVLESLKREFETKVGLLGNTTMVTFGHTLLVSVLFLMLYLFMYNFRREILDDDRKTIFILLLVTTMTILSSFVLKRNVISIYLIPFTIIPIFVRTFYDSRLALFIHLVTVFLVGFFAPNGFEFVFIHFIAGVVAIISLTNFYRRGKLFLSVSLILLTYWVLYTGIVTIQEGTPLKVNPITLAWFAGNALLLLASYQLVYIFEKVFGFLSDATLMELSDTNQDLLRQLAEVAPGTFQHSLQVANLTETAINKIGGNAMLARTGALYHDIGKMNNPFYFVENQSPEFNPHKNIDFEESAEIIIKHITDGVTLARKHRLPEQIIDFIRTHHGTSKVQYFYRLFKDKYPDAQHEFDKFSYPGPKPFSRETAVLMMADSIEAASRSLKSYSHSTIENLVDTIINHQQLDDQFSEANITFQDITALKMVFKKKLLNIYHARIEYPKEGGNA